MSFEIEKGVPMPKPRQPATAAWSRLAEIRDVFGQMEIGDSILVGDVSESVKSNFHIAAYKAGIRITIRKVAIMEPSLKTCRLWRIA